MKRVDDSLVTPIFLKKDGDDELPRDEKVFYVLAGDGLFLCRNHEFFQSCVPAPRFPSELEDQQSFLEVDYPTPPRRKIEEVVGFFDAVWRSYGGEAAVFLAWNRKSRKVEVIVPEQLSTVSQGYRGDLYPVGVHYRIPEGLPGHLTIFCDIHSHCDLAAYTSSTDAHDETYRAGLHAVVGRLNDEEPQFHVEAVVDGTRFRVDPQTVFGGFRKRSPEFPRAWMESVRVKSYSYSNSWSRDSWRDGTARDGTSSDDTRATRS